MQYQHYSAKDRTKTSQPSSEYRRRHLDWFLSPYFGNGRSRPAIWKR